MRPVRSFLVLVLAFLAGPAEVRGQWPPDSLTNLQVLPRDIAIDDLVRMMAGFTRALGVRCSHCHFGQEGAPLSTYDFASDDRLLKRKARVMIRMVRQLNRDLADELPSRAAPPIEVQCFTCHRGVREPRTLQAVLLAAHAAGGLDSAVAAYRALRERYYGRAAYDFGEVALADVAAELDRLGRLADAVAIGELNVEMNPGSAFARRSHAGDAMTRGFRQGAVEGRAAYHDLAARYGAAAVGEALLNQVGYRLLGGTEAAAAVEVFRLNVELHPDSWNAHDSLGEGFAAQGDTARAIASYRKSLELNPQNANAAERLRRLEGR